MILSNHLHKSFQRFPDKEAVILVNKRLTYRKIYHNACMIAQWLIDQGVCKGDRIVILLDTPAEYISTYFGILMTGGIAVASNTQTTPRTLNYLINNCQAAYLITHIKFSKIIFSDNNIFQSLNGIVFSDFDESLKTMPVQCYDLDQIISAEQGTGSKGMPDIHINADDPAQIIYTSGTTGKPKGVVLSHGNLYANTQSIIEYLQLGPDEKHMVVLPFFYAFGNSLLLTHIAVGATLIVHQNFMYPKVILDLMAAEQITGLSGVPSTFALLLNRAPLREYSFPHLRYLAQAGGPLSVKHARQLREIFSDKKIFIMYGQTEAGARLSYLPPRDFDRKPGSIGKAIPGVTLTLVDKTGNPVQPGETGEISARGDNIMLGYWDDPDKSSQVLTDSGLLTGDLAKIDNEGYFYLISRKSEMIKSGAHRIGPLEIENVLLELKAVAEAAVLGVPDEILGEAIKACLVLKENLSCTKKDILAHCRHILPAYKFPHHIVFMDSLPKTASGKVIKAKLKSV